MSQKTFIWIGVFLGSTIGGFIPSLWGDNMLSLMSLVLSAVGGFAGIWAGYKAYNVMA